MNAKILAKAWRGYVRGEVAVVPDDDLTRDGLEQGLIADANAAPQPTEDPVEVQPEPEATDGT